MRSEQPRSRRSRGSRVDLAAGILLGLALGIAVAYLLVIVVSGSRDASDISTPSPPPAETTTGPPRSGAPARP